MQFKSSISNILPKEKYIKKRDSPDLERDVWQIALIAIEKLLFLG